MEFRILGPLEVFDGDRSVPLPGGRGRALLAILVLHAGELVSADRLIDELWGASPPPTANKSLQNLVSDLRRRLSLGRDGGVLTSMLQTAEGGYVLRIDPDQVDANRFRGLLGAAADAGTPERAAQLRTALELWHGPALADFSYEPFAQNEIAVLDELRMRATEEGIDAELALGRHGDVLGELKGLVAEHPLRERLRAQLMLALYRCSRQAEALEVYREGRETLIEDLGLEPGPALSELEQAILRQDPSLDAPTAEATAVEPRIGTEHFLTAERKSVTVVYVDFTASAPTEDDTDLEVAQPLLAGCIEDAKGIMGRHGGTVEGFIGGVLVAVFGVPTAHEDDALRAVRAAAEVRGAVAASAGTKPGIPLVTSAGVNTGEIVVGGSTEPMAVSGDTVKLAARLQQAAGSDDILLSETTRQLLGAAAQVESAATLVLDRRGRPATVWRLVALRPHAPARPPDRDRPTIGRNAELAKLHAAFQRVRREGRASLLTVLGEPGIGKSRLALEFAGTLPAGSRVLTGRCPSYGEGITFWPLREIVVEAVGDRGAEGIAALLADEDDAGSIAERIAGAVGFGPESAAARDLFPAVRRLFEALARDRGLAIVVDDIHRAQPTFLDLLSYLADAVRGPLLVVCLARPELLETNRGWVEGPDQSALLLEPLGPEDSERLVSDRLAGRIVPEELVGRVVEMAQGNPLFIEQLVAALRDRADLPVPPSVHALLADRLDRLGPAERDLLRCASVIGTEFSPDALSVLIPPEAGPFVDRHLEVLEDKELVVRLQRTFLGDTAHGFRHALIQRAAYRSLTRADRADLHERFAKWLEDGAPEMEDLVGYHLEQAHAQRRRLGLADESTSTLGVRAGEWLAAAGLRAYRRFDMTAAENLLSRARALLPADHDQRYEVLRRLAEAYPTLGRLRDAEDVLPELLDDRRVQKDARLRTRLRLEQLRVRLIAGPDPVRHDTIRAEVARALEVLEPLEDHVGISQACYLLATMHQRSGEMRELVEVAERGLDHARRSGDLREILGALWWPAWVLVDGPTPVAEAIRSCKELMDAGGGEHPALLTDLARLRAMAGEIDVARELIATARRHVVERIRVRRPLTVIALRAAEVEILAGDLEAARQALRSVVEIAVEVGERDQTSQVASGLSRVLSGDGEVEGAARYASLGREQAPAESVIAQALWRAATAQVTADATKARALVEEAIAHVPADMLNLRAGLHLDLATLLFAGGEQDLAVTAIGDAAALYERKGNLLGAERAARRRAGLTAAPS